MSPKAWKTSFSEFHWNYNPRSSLRSSFRSPEKPHHSTLPRGSSSIMGSSHHSILETSESRDQDTELNHSEMPSPSRDGENGPEAAGGDSKQKEEERSVKEEESEPSAECDEKAPPSESSSEENFSCDSESLEHQLSAVAAADSSLLHIDESDGSLEDLNVPKENGLGNISGMKDLSSPHKVCVPSSTRLMKPLLFVIELLSVSSRMSLWKTRPLWTQRAQRYKMFIFRTQGLYGFVHLFSLFFCTWLTTSCVFDTSREAHLTEAAARKSAEDWKFQLCCLVFFFNLSFIEIIYFCNSCFSV